MHLHIHDGISGLILQLKCLRVQTMRVLIYFSSSSSLSLSLFVLHKQHQDHQLHYNRVTCYTQCVTQSHVCGSRYIHNPRPLTYVYGKSEHTYTTQCSRTRTPIYLLGMVSNSTSNYLNIFTIGTHRTLTFFLCSTAAAAASSVRLSFSHSIPIFSFRFYLYYIHSFIIHISLCLLYTKTNCSEKSFDQI